jgi:hypothetical protein
MPKGLPTASDLIGNRSVTFFSIDTDIIQSLGYKFKEGALFALHLQRPTWLRIQLTEVVQREVMAHRMEPVDQSIEELRSALAKTQRLSGYDMSQVQKAISDFPLSQTANDRFVDEFNVFLKNLDGSVLSLDGPDLAKKMFSRYFDEAAPFEARKEKKFEFPDAAALLVLESHAQENKTQGILISKDAGWSNFAKESSSLYCVKSLDEFVALFESTGDNADLVKSKVREALEDPESELSLEIEKELSRDMENAYWRVDDVYSNFSVRVEADVVGIGCTGYEIDARNLSLWFIEHDPTVCTVEFTATVDVNLNIALEFYQYDTIDHDEFNVASDEIERDVQIDVDVFLTCYGDLLNSGVNEWKFGIGISGGRYRVDVGAVDPEFNEYEDER